MAVADERRALVGCSSGAGTTSSRVIADRGGSAGPARMRCSPRNGFGPEIAGSPLGRRARGRSRRSHRRTISVDPSSRPAVGYADRSSAAGPRGAHPGMPARSATRNLGSGAPPAIPPVTPEHTFDRTVGREEDTMDPLVVAAVALLALAGGAVLGFLARGMFATASIKAAEEKAALIVEKARSQQKDLILEAKDEKLRLQREAEDEARAKRTELSNLERRLLQRDEQLDQRTDMLEQRDRKLLDRERELDKCPRGRRQRPPGAGRRRSSGSAACPAEDAKALLLEAVREEAEHDAVKLARAIERQAREEADEKARDIIVTAIQRVAADHTAEHTVTVDPPAERRDEGPDHRPRGPQHPGPRAGDRRRPDHRRHARDRGPERLRPGPPRDRPARDHQAHQRRPDPPRPDRGGRRQGPRRGRPGHPPGRRAGRLRRRRARPAAGDHQAPRPAQVPHELRPERAQPRRRDEPPRGGHRGRDRGRRPDRQDGRPAPRHRQGGRPRGRGAARRDRRRRSPSATTCR